MYWYASPNQIRDQIRCKYIKYAPYFIESLLFAFSFLETPQMTLFHPYIWVLIHANIVLICRIQVHVKYASNTHQIRNQIQANMGVLGARPRWAVRTCQIRIKYAIKYTKIWVYLTHDPGGLSTCQIRIKYAIKYTQIWVYLTHDPGGLSTCQIRIKYASKYKQISNTQANTIKYGCTWRWVEYTSNVHQIRKQIQANMGVIGIRPWWAEYTSNIHQILK